MRQWDDPLAPLEGLVYRRGLEELHDLLLEKLAEADNLDWERTSVDAD